jgi:sigma-B regulation protein RsbU (phosphoserine phosphatase)
MTVMLNAVRKVDGEAVYDVVSITVAEERNKYERQLVLERKRSEALAQKEVREAEDRALFAEQMVGIVSHDLRNPLAAIAMGAAAIARDATLGAKHAKLLDNVNRSSLRARRLIDELLDFTLVRVGHGLTVVRQVARFHELVGQFVEELKLSFPANPISHTAHGPGNCCVDPDRIAQLLGNLVANAVTYGEPGGAVTVTSRGDDEAGCSLSVHNAGQPIPEAMLERIFEPLIRGGTPDQSKRSVGLGLFIVKAIAEAHEGSMTVTSLPDAGTTFTLAFGRAADAST